MRWIVLCLLFLTGMSVYVPTIYIRKTNRLIRLLEEIAANTRK